jgi:acetyltransferase-like isoleucine patch superfamily enzyme
MNNNRKSIFHLFKPGDHQVDGDWCQFPIPSNIEVGEDTVIDSSSIFKKFFSELPLGLKIGDHVTLQSPSLAAEKNGYIEIGDYSFISGATLVAIHKIIIGKYVFIAGGVTIVDSDFHPLDPGSRLTDTVAISTIGDKSRRPSFDFSPVIIEDDVWIGFNATILKGVTVGKGSIIQPGAVVSKNIPPGSIVSGNPAEVKAYEHA